MRKIWPSEDNCSKHVRISHNSPSLCEIRTTPSPCAKLAQHLLLVRNSHSSPCNQTTSKDVFPEDERLNFWFLGVKEARITLNGQYMFSFVLFSVSCNLCMPYWIRDQEGRLVRIENPQDTELDICVNIMDPPPEDQNSQHGQGGIWRPSMLVLIMALIHDHVWGDFMSKNPEEAMDF
ncbi:hypothetical protein AAG906_003723 [Vitis piasezkii]